MMNNLFMIFLYKTLTNCGVIKNIIIRYLQTVLGVRKFYPKKAISKIIITIITIDNRYVSFMKY